jgi:hypothetical protein
MKRTTIITIISFLIPILGMSQTKSTFVDDLYLKPSDAKTQQTSQSQLNQQTQDTKQITNYKNGAKEIIYIDRENSKEIHDTVYINGKAYIDGQVNNTSDNDNKEGLHDTTFVVSEDNDSIENNQEQGYYLNGFNGTESDLEYAKRIRQFHNPRYEISVADPRYNDINYLNNYDWNVYIDGSYAYVTPTWTNPYWWNYNYNPYSYGNWGFGINNFYSPYSYYPGWFDSPWGYDDFYGDFGYGYGDYYGYGYGGYGYNNRGNNWFGRNNGRNSKHDEGTRRDISNLSSAGRVGGINNSAQIMSGGGGYNSSNPYTVVSNTGLRSGSQNLVKTTGTRINNPSNSSTSRILSTNRNGIGLVRTGGLRNLINLNQNNNRSTGSRTFTTYTINTNPRTNRNTLSSNPAIVNSGTNRISNSTNINTNSGNYSTVSRSSSSPIIYNSSSSRSSSSFSSGNSSYSSGNSSSSRSSGSYSGGGSGGGSRSSGGGGGGRR